MTSLGRFLSRAREKGLPFYHNLKKPSNFEWTKEASVAFQQLKTYLSSPPLLVVPLSRVTLYFYMDITCKVVSSVFCASRNNNMSTIYYVGHVLNGPEEWYGPFEKNLLNLVVTARKLKPYFKNI